MTPLSEPITFDGRTLTLKEWAAHTGLGVTTLRYRLQCGWPPSKAFTARPLPRYRRGGRPRASAPRPCPPLKEHRGGRAYCRWKAGGRSHERYFGPWGSPEARAAYSLFAAEWAAGAKAAPAGGGALVGEAAVAWLEWADREYRKGGEHTSEYPLCRLAARAVADYAATPAAGFGPAQLRAIRERWVGAGLARKTVNGYQKRIVRMFKWAVGRGLVPAAVHAALAAVETLKAGRSLAQDRPPRRPVGADGVAAVLPHLPARVAAMVRLQEIVGMRPGEVCKLRPRDLDTAADVWRYTVPGGKNLHRNRVQVYYFGPLARAVLGEFLAGVGEDQRVFPMTRQRYWKAVRLACTLAKIPPWTPHQLRHSFATAVAERFRSLDHAAAAIGDTNAVAQAVYVHVDPRERARIEVAKAMG